MVCKNKVTHQRMGRKRAMSFLSRANPPCASVHGLGLVAAGPVLGPARRATSCR